LISVLAHRVRIASPSERWPDCTPRDSTPPNAHPYRKRVYFYDPEGNDWEFIQYLSQDPAERNDYKLPDR
jgi:hypothetical protein